MQQSLLLCNPILVVRKVIMLSLAVAACARAGWARDFIVPKTFPSGGSSAPLVVADFNRDGKPDIASGNWVSTGGNVGVLLGNGDGTFQAPVLYNLGSAPSQMAVGDFNNDGYPDLAVITNGTTYILINQGNGTFKQATTLSAYYDQIVVGDFNGDGKLDLVAVSYSSDVVVVMLGKGDGTLQSGVSYPAGNCTDGVTIGDFNHDGKLDLAVINSVCYEGTINQLNIFMGNGDGSFQSPVSYLDTGAPVLVSTGDFNGDGNLDVAVVNAIANEQAPDTLQIFLGTGNGTFKLGSHVSIEGGYVPEPNEMLIADFNGDGIPDVAVSDNAWGVTVLSGDGTGGFKLARHYGIGFTCGLAGGDFRGNQRTDLVTSCSLGNVAVLPNNGHGGFAGPIAYRRFPAAEDAVIGDFNGDGIPDLLVTEHPANQNSTHTDVTVSLGIGDGTFGATITSKLPFGGNWQDYLYAAAGDFNGDAKLDAAVIAETSGWPVVDILIGNGDGSFQLGRSYPLAYGFLPGPILAADFNHDGIPDLVTSYGDGICILIGKGDGTFKDPQPYSTGGRLDESNVAGIVIGDFNHDGNLDLAVANYCDSCEAGSVGVLFGDSSGGFGSPVTYAVEGSLEEAIVSADFNKDGNLDLAVTDLQNNALYVYLGDGRGNFRLSHTLAAGFYPYSLVAADFNHDGNADLLVGDNGGGDGPTELSMLHGKGNGNFETAVEYEVDFWPVAMTVGDLSGKGASDLVVVNNLQSVTVYLNRTGASR
jgi:hypothetical protein